MIKFILIILSLEDRHITGYRRFGNEQGKIKEFN